MRPALTLSTRRAKSSTCLLKQCRSFLIAPTTTPTTTMSTLTATAIKRVPHLPALWFLVTTRSNSTQAPLKEEKKHLFDKYHPRVMNKDVSLDSLFSFLSASKLTSREKFKSLRTALYNTTQYDAQKAWLIYERMVRYRADKYLKLNHYGYLLCILKYGDSLPRMLTVLEKVKKSNPGKDIDYHISQVLFTMARQGLVEEACQLIETTTQPSANHYHSLAIALKNNISTSTKNQQKSIDLVTESMFTGIEKHQISLSNTTFSIILSLLSNEQQKLRFLKLMDGKSNKTQPYNVYIYTSLISGFARQGDSESAKRIFDEMLRHKIEPNQVTFAGLMEAYSKAGDFPQAIRLLTEYSKRFHSISSPIVTSLLVNAIRHNNLQVAENAIKFITKKKRMHTRQMDSVLMAAIVWVKTRRDVEEARKYFDKLYEKDESLVNTIMVNHLMTGYGLKKDKENLIDAYNLNQKLGPLSLTEQERSKHHLTNALFHCRDVPAAMSVFISMRKQDIPDDITLAMVIQGLVMNNENNLAWRLFKTLQSDGIEPNLHAYTTVLKALGHKESDLKKKQGTSGLSNDLIKAAGIRLPTLDYLHSTVPTTTEALNLFRRLTGFEQPNVYTYTTLISCFAKHDITRAISIFDHMCASNVQPTVETYTAVLQGCSIFRNSQMALTVFNHMCERRVEPNQVTWRYLMKSLLRSRVDKKQIDKIAEMAKKSLDKKVD